MFFSKGLLTNKNQSDKLTLLANDVITSVEVSVLGEDRNTIERIHSTAEAEFLEKGFQSASLRNIVKAAGVTTGAFYRYYPTKEALFEALVKPHADHVKQLYFDAVAEWEARPDAEKVSNLSELSGKCLDAMMDYIYEHYHAFKLLLCASAGTMYEDFTHELVETEVEATFRCADIVRGMGYEMPQIDPLLCHMLTSGLFTAVFESVMHDVDKETAKRHVHMVKEFHSGGWSRLMNFELH